MTLVVVNKALNLNAHILCHSGCAGPIRSQAEKQVAVSKTPSAQSPGMRDNAKQAKISSVASNNVKSTLTLDRKQELLAADQQRRRAAAAAAAARNSAKNTGQTAGMMPNAEDGSNETGTTETTETTETTRADAKMAEVATGTKTAGWSAYRGVRKSKSVLNPWRAIITINGKRKQIGSFHTAIDAARAYDTEATKHGRLLNFPTVDGCASRATDPVQTKKIAEMKDAAVGEFNAKGNATVDAKATAGTDKMAEAGEKEGTQQDDADPSTKVRPKTLGLSKTNKTQTTKNVKGVSITLTRASLLHRARSVVSVLNLLRVFGTLSTAVH